MTDEEYGRAWAELAGRAPRRSRSRGGYVWRVAASPGAEGRRWHLPPPFLGLGVAAAVYSGRAEAYAALGRAVRRIHADVPRLPGG